MKNEILGWKDPLYLCALRVKLCFLCGEKRLTTEFAEGIQSEQRYVIEFMAVAAVQSAPEQIIPTILIIFV